MRLPQYRRGKYLLHKTGNWSETNDLKEENSEEFKPVNQNSKIKLISFLGLLGSLFVWLLFSGVGNGSFNILQIIGPLVTSYLAYNYLTPEYGSSFVVHFNKIQKNRILKRHFHSSFHSL